MTEKKDKQEYRPNCLVLFGIGLILFLIFSNTFSPLGMSLAFGIIFSLLTLDLLRQQKGELKRD